MQIYKRIRELREDGDLTQSFVGEKIGVPQRTYSHYECGTRMITPQALTALACLYNVSVDYLLELTDERKPYARKK